MQRRDLFRQLSLSAAWLAWQQLFGKAAQAQAPAESADRAEPWQEKAEVFTLGVASGEPRPDSVVLWTRLAPQPERADGGMPERAVAVQWEVALDARFTQVVQSGSVLAEPRRAHSVHLDVMGLQPGRDYHYRFLAGGQRSPVGRTRTAPESGADVSRLRVALASCQHFEAGHFAVHREIAAADVDLVLFVGDYLYASSLPGHSVVRRHRHRFPDDPSRYTLADYRLHHAAYRRDADLRACHAAHPWLLIWDDNEVLNDHAGLSEPDARLDREAFVRLRTAAYQAYFEHLPISPTRAPVGPDMALQGRYAWGKLAELWLLDTRQFRSEHVCGGEWQGPLNGRLLWNCAAANSDERSVLGAPQEAWLARGLAGSASAWKLVAQTGQVTPSGLDLFGQRVLYGDGWSAFPAARRRLIEAIVQPRVPDVVLLGGDVHRHVAGRIRRNPDDPQSPVVASEIVTTSLTSRGLSEFISARVKASNPDLLHLRSDERGYVLLDITPERIVSDFRATAHPVRAASTLRTQVRYRIDRGVAGPRRMA